MSKNYQADNLLLDYRRVFDAKNEAYKQKEKIGEQIRQSKVDSFFSKGRWAFFIPTLFYYVIMMIQTQDPSWVFNIQKYDVESYDQTISMCHLLSIAFLFIYSSQTTKLRNQVRKYQYYNGKINPIDNEFAFAAIFFLFIAIFSCMSGIPLFNDFAANAIWIQFFVFLCLFVIVTLNISKSKKTAPSEDTFENLNEEFNRREKHFLFLKSKVLENQHAMKIIIDKNKNESFKYEEHYSAYSLLITDLVEISEKIKERNKQNKSIQESFNHVYRNEENLKNVLIENK